MTDRGAQHASDIPDVSVIVAAWKATAFIKRAITTALSSTDVKVEVVIVDDASPDGTFDVLKRLADSDARIVIDRLPANAGPSAARNRAIELSRGRYIAVLDADDAVTSDRFENLVTLADDRGADIAVDNMTEVDDAGRMIGDGSFLKSADFSHARDIDLETWVKFNQPAGGGDCIGYLKPLIRRQKLTETGAVYDTSLRNSEDYYLIANLLAAGARMTYTPTPGYLYTRAAGSISHRLKPDYTRAWLGAETRFLARFHDRLSPNETAALAKRGRTLRNINQFVAAVEAIQMRKFGAAVGLMASDPRASAYTLSTLGKIALGKVLRRKLV